MSQPLINNMENHAAVALVITFLPRENHVANLSCDIHATNMYIGIGAKTTTTTIS